MSEQSWGGFSEKNGGGSFVQIHTKDLMGTRDQKAQVYFTRGGTRMGNQIDFVFKGASMKWQVPEAASLIKAHWELTLDINIGSEAAKLSLHSHWSGPIFGSVVNQLLGSLDYATKDGRMSIFIYAKPTKKVRDGIGTHILSGTLRDASGKIMGNKFPFISAEVGFDGVPNINTDSKEAVQQFWVEQAKSLVSFLGGSIDNGGAAGQATQTAQEGAGLVDRALKYLKTYAVERGVENATAEAIAKLAENLATPAEVAKFVADAKAWLIHSFLITAQSNWVAGKWVESKLPSKTTDDLPF